MPTTLDEALDVLAEVGEDGKVLAGGQSLVPMLNMRLVSPEHLVDINALSGLGGIDVSPAGVRVGALARHGEVEHHVGARAAVPLLGQALRLVAHPVIRNRGTTVGSLVHADPSGEMPAVLSLLGGHMELARKGSTRTVAAGEFFVGPLESCIEPGELAISAWFPALPARSGTSFCEVARRHGDYAMCGVAAAVTLDEDGRVVRARTSYVSMSETPVVLELTDAVVGQFHETADWNAAARLSSDGLNPEPDIHATAEYRRHLGVVLTRQALREAAAAAASSPEQTTPYQEAMQ
ncbi:MAG: xanthine dehydrogenase family protein subunit M [Actinomadura sp.]